MKKNSILIFICLIVAFSCNPAQNIQQQTVSNTKKAKNIILLIGDGMGTAQIYAGLTANKGHLNLERCRHIGFSKTNSSDKFITDSAAGATAFSIGQKTYNGAIGVDSTGKSQETILETAEKNGLATGMVATCSITHATPASFIAHQPSRALDEDIAADFLKTDIDVFIGGGLKYFAQRTDGRNLVTELKAKNYQIADSTGNLSKYTTGKLAAFMANIHQPKLSQGRGNMLVEGTKTALQILSKNEKGFFLMVEGSQIDWGGHANESDYIVQEMIDFDNAIGTALDFAQKDGETLIIVTADHETGGYALTGGDLKTGKVEGKFVWGNHTGVMVPVFAFGPGAEEFMGMYHNTAIYGKMMDAFNFSKPKQ